MERSMHSPGTRSGLGSGELKQLRLRYAGVCVLCGTHLDQGAEALYDRGTRSVRCLVCPSHGAVDLEPIDSGVAGSSAHMRWQVDAVQRALHSADPDSMPPVTPVLCFVDGEWPLFSAPESYNSVRLEGKKSIRKLVTRLHLLDAAEIDRLTRILHTAFPPK